MVKGNLNKYDSEHITNHSFLTILRKWNRATSLRKHYENFDTFIKQYIVGRLLIYVKRENETLFYQEQDAFESDRVVKLIKKLNKIFLDRPCDTYAILILNPNFKARHNWVFMLSIQDRVLIELMTPELKQEYIKDMAQQLDSVNLKNNL